MKTGEPGKKKPPMMRFDKFSMRAVADLHRHFREGALLEPVLRAMGEYVDIALGMPNLETPITEPEAALAYGDEILRIMRPINPAFRVLTTAYLTDDLLPSKLVEGFVVRDDGRRAFSAAKLYPAGATTNSARGITSLEALYPKLGAMERIGMPLLIHAELLERKTRKYALKDREAAFMHHSFPEITKRFPALRISIEHISSEEGVDAVLQSGPNVVGSITAHHPAITYADMEHSPYRVHADCAPIPKSKKHRGALRKAMFGGSGKFFLGTDDAPHLRSAKLAGRKTGCATSKGALEAYAAIAEEEGLFEREDGVEIFERFTSLDGPRFYGIEPSDNFIELTRAPGVVVDENIFVLTPQGEDEIVPFFHKDLGFAPYFPWRVTRYLGIWGNRPFDKVMR